MLTDQKLASLDQHERWLLNRLAIGHFPASGFESVMDRKGNVISLKFKWQAWLPTFALFSDYEAYLQSHGRPLFSLDAVRFGKFMSRYFKAERPRDGTGDRTHGYRLGELDEARDAFAGYQRLDGLDWDSIDDLDAPAAAAGPK
jgi:hypothetical protein